MSDRSYYVHRRRESNVSGEWTDAMAHGPFSLQDSLIAYGPDKGAAPLPRSPAAFGDAAVNCLLGTVDFTDDESVHADHWECHPDGDEVLCVLEGRLLAAVDRDGATEEAVIGRGQAFIVPRASWHRLRVLEPGRLLFVTPRAGTALRPHASAAAGTTDLQKGALLPFPTSGNEVTS
jgi:mannose-6-phosphate isomerase-like protein (cupin superfamily)